jgi:hypothetical protein
VAEFVEDLFGVSWIIADVTTAVHATDDGHPNVIAWR